MDKEIRNKLRNVVTNCRKLLEDSIGEQLQGHFGIHADGKIEDESDLPLNEEDVQYRRDILDHFEHIKAGGYNAKDSLAQLIREIAFTHLNRFCAYKMMAARDVVIGGKKFRDPIGSGKKTGPKSNAFMFYLADHPNDEKLANSGKQDRAYRHFLDWVGEQLSEEIGVLFNPNDPANRLYPSQRVMDDIFDLLNKAGIKDDKTELKEEWPKIWSEDETIGWVYQYFTPKELRDEARSGNKPPANSYELAFRNQFFTPRYVVEFLTDNTLGRIWYEMRQGETHLTNQCKFLVRPNEVFLGIDEDPPELAGHSESLNAEEQQRQTVFVTYRPKKDPRELRIIDPACGSAHFLLYCFDLLLTIYSEAYEDLELGESLQKEFVCKDDFLQAVPGLIIANNLHGIDIDQRASQIASLALWLRAQRAYSDLGVRERPAISRSLCVCAEPMPENKILFDEFTEQLQPPLLKDFFDGVFDGMKQAGDLGSLLEIEREIQGTIRQAKQAWVDEHELASDQKGNPLLFSKAEIARLEGGDEQTRFSFEQVTDSSFFATAEQRVLALLQQFSEESNDSRHQRRLFLNNANRGFAFIDICSRRFDVVLMNPPFGAPIPSTREYIADNFTEGKNDLCAAEVMRGLNLLESGGLLGAITTRTALFVQSFAEWRKWIFSKNRFTTVADLGYGVLDAMVETAMYVIEKGGSSQKQTQFLRVLTSKDKSKLVNEILSNNAHEFLTSCSSDVFLAIPGSPMPYWVPQSLLRTFIDNPSFNSGAGEVCVGVQTGDNFRFLRLFWEVEPERINANAPVDDREFLRHFWAPFAKGGEYSPWWDDIHLLLFWHNNGQAIRTHPSSCVRNTHRFFQAGGTYPYRTTSAFAMRNLPAGCIFSDGGWGVFRDDPSETPAMLALYNSRFARYFMEILLGQGDSSVSGSAARNHVNEAVGGVPWLPSLIPNDVSEHVQDISNLRRSYTSTETSPNYKGPRLVPTNGNSFAEAIKRIWSNRCDTLTKIAKLSFQIDESVSKTFGISDTAKTYVDDEEGPHPCSYPPIDGDREEITRLLNLPEDALISNVQDKIGSRRFVVKKSFFVDRKIDLICHHLKVAPQTVIDCLRALPNSDCPISRELAVELVSFCVGVLFGRWDLFAATDPQANNVIDCLASLPVRSPAMFEQKEGEYPIGIDEDGIIALDNSSHEGLSKRIGQLLEMIWPNTEDVEGTVCKILGVKNLNQYFQKPTKGGFWSDHIARYSKSRRKAPIYWLLQSRKKSFSVWIYYHCFDADTLFKVLKSYVEPKWNFLQSELNSTSEKIRNASETGDTAKVIKKLESERESFEELAVEIEAFKNSLTSVAQLNLVPDLDDGVVLNIAPLSELVPWSEARKYLKQLEEGKYEWSSVSQQMREKGLVKAK